MYNGQSKVYCIKPEGTQRVKHAQTKVHIKMVSVSIVTAWLILRKNTNTHSYLEALWCIFFYRVLYLNNWISICK